MDGVAKQLIEDCQDRLDAALQLGDIAERFPDLVVQLGRALDGLEENQEDSEIEEDSELEDTHLEDEESVDESQAEVEGDEDSQIETTALPSDVSEAPVRLNSNRMKAVKYLVEHPEPQERSHVCREVGIPIGSLSQVFRHAAFVILENGLVELVKGFGKYVLDSQFGDASLGKGQPSDVDSSVEESDETEDIETVTETTELRSAEPSEEAPKRKPRKKAGKQFGTVDQCDTVTSGVNGTRQIVFAELSLHTRPLSVREIAAATKYTVPHLEKVLDHEWFEKVGNGYRIVEQK